ncbi:MAG TPA: efflux RND transporter periplasmic adaptor subunit [Terriglobales bacterium]|nr:efflux RND transporter periplasmic adaptor subunit [Terriglobales bacterium]
MKKARIAIVVLIVAGIAAAFGYRYVRANRTDTRNMLKLSGNIEVTEAEISFKIPGRVERRFVDEGETVRTGQQIALLDSSELRDEVAVRQAEVRTALAQLRELQHGSRPEEIAQGEANLNMVKAEEVRLRADRVRFTTLHDKDLISTQSWEAAVTAHEMAKARVRDAEERLTLLRKGPREEKISQAQAQLQRARNALAASETRLGYVSVNSPVSGVVLSKNIEAGEYVSPGTPIVTVGDVEHVWVRAYVDETDLGRVRLGQPVCVETDTYPGKQYNGRIGFISSQAEFTPKMVQTEKERVKLVYRIKVYVDNPNQELKPGMPADALISLTGDSKCQPSSLKASANNSGN